MIRRLDVRFSLQSSQTPGPIPFSEGAGPTPQGPATRPGRRSKLKERPPHLRAAACEKPNRRSLTLVFDAALAHRAFARIAVAAHFGARRFFDRGTRFQGVLRRSEARDRHAERRATDVGQADPV